jgi:hypothetical protein
MYKVLLATTFEPLADRVSRTLRPFGGPLPVGGHGFLASFLPLQNSTVSIVLFLLCLQDESSQVLIDAKETIQPDLTIITSPGLFARKCDNQPTVFVCPKARVLSARRNKLRKTTPLKIEDVTVNSLEVGRRRSQVITAWSRQEQWKAVFRDHFSHNEPPLSFVSEALYCDLEEKSLAFSQASSFKLVRVVDTLPNAFQDIRFFRESSAMILHAPLRYFELEAGDGEMDDNDRRSVVSSDLILSLTAHIAHMDVGAQLRDQPPSPKGPVGTATWIGSRSRVEACIRTISSWLPDESLEIKSVKKGSIIVELDATNRDAVILQAIFASGIHELLLEEDESLRKIRKLPTLSRFAIRSQIEDLPLRYADFADDIEGLGEKNGSDDRSDIFRKICNYWVHQPVVSKTAEVIAGCRKLDFNINRCG